MNGITETYGWTDIDPKDLKTLDACEKLAGRVFDEVAARYGPVKAAAIFAKYGKLTKTERKLRDKALVLSELRRDMKASGGKLNVHNFSIRWAKKKGIKNPGAVERAIWRMLKDPKRRAPNYLEYLDRLEAEL
jgi:hypothetical protein